LLILLKESIDGLDIHTDDTYLDLTLGNAGHARYALEKMKGKITVIGIDEDIEALERSRQNLIEKDKWDKDRIFLEKSNYRDIDKVLKDLRIEKVNRIMLDLGISSNQIEESGRGFTFQKDEPLLMTFAKNIRDDDLTAEYIVNNWAEESIADIIYGYGEERYARRIAKAIIVYRKKKVIQTTFELVEIIKSAVPRLYLTGRIHPATRTFQALRIAVNDELNGLKEVLNKGFERLEKGGRIAVISFHSLEDRIVKNFNKEKADNENAKIITKKPIIANDKEIEENPRARSAKLRIIEK
ncbi:MAG TPA: 16S rRNA (cytosine(1402)-N(4))-methyltransferase RsmH, partial [Candidatus Paceibacterota bacterium]